MMMVMTAPLEVLRIGEQIIAVYIYHDASVSSIGVIIYVQTVNGKGDKHFRIVRSGTKCENLSVPVLEHISRSYAIVLLKPIAYAFCIETKGGNYVNFLLSQTVHVHCVHY